MRDRRSNKQLSLFGFRINVNSLKHLATDVDEALLSTFVLLYSISFLSSSSEVWIGHEFTQVSEEIDGRHNSHLHGNVSLRNIKQRKETEVQPYPRNRCRNSEKKLNTSNLNFSFISFTTNELQYTKDISYLIKLFSKLLYCILG